MACTSTMTFEDCELAILRENVDKAEKEQGKYKLTLSSRRSNEIIMYFTYKIIKKSYFKL